MYNFEMECDQGYDAVTQFAGILGFWSNLV